MVETLEETLNAFEEIDKSFIARNNILYHLKFGYDVKACEGVVG